MITVTKSEVKVHDLEKGKNLFKFWVMTKKIGNGKSYLLGTSFRVYLFNKYQYKSEEVEWKNQDIFASIPDQTQQESQPNSTQSSRNSSLERTTRRLFDHMKPDNLNINSTVNKVRIWQSRFKQWIRKVLKPDNPSDE